MDCFLFGNSPLNFKENDIVVLPLFSNLKRERTHLSYLSHQSADHDLSFYKNHREKYLGFHPFFAYSWFISIFFITNKAENEETSCTCRPLTGTCFRHDFSVRDRDVSGQ